MNRPFHVILSLLICLTMASLALTGCSSSDEDVFVPFPAKNETDKAKLWEIRHPKACQEAKVSLAGDDILTQKNFEAVFTCANHDGELDDLKNLVNSGELPKLISHANAMIKSDGFSNIKETLEPWFKENAHGESRVDRLLPVLASTIKNRAFQKSLPLMQNFLASGQPVWRTLLPRIGDVFADPRFPDVYERMPNLWRDSMHLEKATDEAVVFWQRIAKVMQLKMEDGETFAAKFIDAADSINQLELKNTSLQAFLYHMNNRDVLRDFYLGGASHRLEQVQPEIYLIPFANENQMQMFEGVTDTQELADIRKKWAKPLLFKGGDQAPIHQLLKLVESLNKPHPNFLSKLVAWYGNEQTGRKRLLNLIMDFTVGKKVDDGMATFVGSEKGLGKQLADLVKERQKTQSKLQLADYVPKDQKCKTRQEKKACRAILKANPKISRLCAAKRLKGCTSIDQITDSLLKAVQSPEFRQLLEAEVARQNLKQFGAVNASLIAKSTLVDDLQKLYASKEMVDYFRSGSFVCSGTNCSDDDQVTIDSFTKLIRKALNGYVDKVRFGKTSSGAPISLRRKMREVWADNVRGALGEELVLNLGMELTGTYFKELVSKDSVSDRTLIQWFFTSTYTNPSNTELLLVLLDSKTPYLKMLRERREYIKEVIVPEIFGTSPEDQSDVQLARQLLDQVDNYLLYIQSGFARSGNDLGRAMSERDPVRGDAFRHYFIDTYAELLTDVSSKNLDKKLVPVWRELCFAKVFFCKKRKFNIADEFQYDQRKRAAEAFDRVMGILFEPREAGNFATTLAEELLVPVRKLVDSQNRQVTEDFLLAMAVEIQNTPREDLFEFLRGVKTIGAYSSDPAKSARMFQELAEVLRKERLPDLINSLDLLFREDAVRPTLNFVADKIDDGSAEKFLLFIRRVLSIKQ